jgi:hypothetical protein
MRLRLRRRPPLTVIAALGLAMLVTVPSGAMVVAHLVGTPAGPPLTVGAAAGTLAIGNSRAGRAILSARAMRPGERATGTVTLSNTGDGPEAIALAAEGAVDRAGVRGGRLSERLVLTVADVSGAGQSATVYAGPLRALGLVRLGVWPAGAVHTFRFTVRFADGGVAGADNAYQGASATIGFRWTASDGARASQR